MTMRLPPIGLPIPPAWDSESEARWQQLSRSARVLHGRSTAVGVTHQAEALRPLLHRGATDEVIRLVVNARGYARALTWLWTEVDGDCRDSISVQLVEALRAAHPRPSTLMREQLARVFFMRFDELDELPTGDGVLASLGLSLRDSGAFPYVASPRSLPTVLTHRDAPLAVAHHVRRQAGDPEAAFVSLGLAPYEGGRYMELVRQHLFLEELRAMPFGATSPVLEQVTRPETHRKPHLRGRMLGHAALEILIDRSEQDYPGDAWRDAVIEVADDPRLDYKDSYAEWWRPLGKTREDRVAAWLARADLQVFLDVLEKYSAEAGSEGMDRMLPPRKTLLDGLLKEGVVRRSRLYLGSDVRRYVWPEKRAAAAELTGSQYRHRALLYLDCGGFHLIEGSHNTQLWIYMMRPPARALDSTVTRFDYRELTMGLGERFTEIWEPIMGTAQGSGFTSIPHAPLWQYKFLAFLAQHGIAVSPEAILSTADYQYLRQRHGLPWVNPNGRPVPLDSEAAHGAS